MTKPISSVMGRALNDRSSVLAESPAYSRTVTDYAVNGQDTATGRLYGVSAVNGHYVTSDDHGVTWDDRTFSSSVYTPNLIDVVLTASYMFGATVDGKVWRAPKDDFDGWSDKSPTVPIGTTGRPSVLAVSPTSLLYGNYNADAPGGSGARVWRSTDNGDTWTNTFTASTARHVHNINVDPSSGVVWMVAGDAGYAGAGLYRSTDDGLTFTKVSGPRYGINVAFQDPTTDPTNSDRQIMPGRLLIEGDGASEPHIIGYPREYIQAQQRPIVYPAATWAGTARGIRLTSEGNLFYISTSESGAVGTKDGCWLAKGPYFTAAVNLEDWTANKPTAYLRTFEAGPYLWNHRSRITRPKFVGQ